MDRAKKIVVSAPLSLAGAGNVRELGGYPTASGAVTRTHMFLRSDRLHRIDDADLAFLYDYGVRLLVDLRTQKEIRRGVSRLMGYRDVEFIHAPFFDNVQSSEMAAHFPSTMGKLYCNLLDNDRESMVAVFSAIARHPDDCALFHCSAGKDRTGTIAMLLLQLAGVADDVIVADYAATENNMREIFAEQKRERREAGIVFPDYLLQSSPIDMTVALHHLKKVYGDARSYLQAIGLSPQQIQSIRKKLVDA